MNLINILIRVTFRPDYFNECINSILNQTYKNFNIICCYDDKLCEKYLEKYKDYILDLNEIQLSSVADITEEEKRTLLKYGYEATLKYIKRRNEKYENKNKKVEDIDEVKDEVKDEVQSETIYYIQSENTKDRKKKEFSKLTEQINDILNYAKC